MDQFLSVAVTESRKLPKPRETNFSEVAGSQFTCLDHVRVEGIPTFSTSTVSNGAAFSILPASAIGIS